MVTKQPAVYILASRLNGTLYTGVTSDLVRRIYEHRNNLADGFTKRYGVHSLVYYELHGDMSEAIHREKQIKKWNRQWKVSLIEQGNPEWHDLWPEITGNEGMDSRIRREPPSHWKEMLGGNDRLRDSHARE